MLIHPGPPDPQRLRVLSCRAHPLRLRLRGGLPLDRAIALALRGAGFRAAWLEMADLPCARLAYVIPAPPPGDGRVAFYSATHHLGAGARILRAGLHVGLGGAIHAHGLWSDGTGLRMGHLRPEATILSRDGWIAGWGLDGAAFRRMPDPETGFTLFAPQPLRRTRPGGRPARLVRLRPNLDLHGTLAATIRPDEAVHGLGSLVGADLRGDPAVPGPAAEILIMDRAERRGGRALCLAAVGAEGVVARGRLEGANPVCITAELLLVAGAGHPGRTPLAPGIRSRAGARSAR